VEGGRPVSLGGSAFGDGQSDGDRGCDWRVAGMEEGGTTVRVLGAIGEPDGVDGRGLMCYAHVRFLVSDYTGRRIWSWMLPGRLVLRSGNGWACATSRWRQTLFRITSQASLSPPVWKNGK